MMRYDELDEIDTDVMAARIVELFRCGDAVKGSNKPRLLCILRQTTTQWEAKKTGKTTHKSTFCGIFEKSREGEQGYNMHVWELTGGRCCHCRLVHWGARWGPALSSRGECLAATTISEAKWFQGFLVQYRPHFAIQNHELTKMGLIGLTELAIASNVSEQ